MVKTTPSINSRQHKIINKANESAVTSIPILHNLSDPITDKHRYQKLKVKLITSIKTK